MKVQLEEFVKFLRTITPDDGIVWETHWWQIVCPPDYPQKRPRRSSIDAIKSVGQLKMKTFSLVVFVVGFWLYGNYYQLLKWNEIDKFLFFHCINSRMDLHWLCILFRTLFNESLQILSFKITYTVKSLAERLYFVLGSHLLLYYIF